MPPNGLKRLFEPRSVALIGASADATSISARPLRLLRQHGFAGAIYPVNPKYQELQGLAVYPSIGAVPEPVDLALVVVPAPVVPRVLEECAAAKVGCAMVITSGFAEAGASGRVLQSEIAAIARGSELRVAGPNCEGVFNPRAGLCATFSPAVDPEHGFEPVPAGPIAVVSQSGGLAFALLNHAIDRGLRVGPVVSTGNEADLGWADYVDYLLDDPSVRVILSFVESFRQPRGLVEVARKAARLAKPIVVAKIGRSEAGRRAAASHTASLVGADTAYSAAFAQLGVIRVDDVDEMLDLAAYFSVGKLPRGRGLAVLTASGGAGAWLADLCAARGMQLPAPPPSVQQEIRSFIPAYGSVGNPVDITAQAVLGGGFEHALELLAHAPEYDVVVPVGTLVREERFFQTLPDLRKAIDGSEAAVAYFTYTHASPRVIEALNEIGVPCFSTPGRTARALSVAVSYAEFVRSASEVRVLGSTDAVATWPTLEFPVSEVGARAYLAPLGITSPTERLVQSADEAVAAFTELGGEPVALKVQSPALPHKSDVGGVRLGLASADAVQAAFDGVLAAGDGVLIEGVLVQRMAPPGGVEMFVAARLEPLLGPMVVVGFGGLDVESNADVAMRLAPVSLDEARSMVQSLRGGSLLRGSRGRSAMDLDALLGTVVRVSELAAGLPDGVATVELNPLLVLPAGDGVLMLDAAIELDSIKSQGSTHAD
jgi:acyl-CoA synthetase (NDP forming)